MDNAVVSITSINAGNAFNVIPQSVLMGGTVRTLREEVRNHIEDAARPPRSEHRRRFRRDRAQSTTSATTR